MKILPANPIKTATKLKLTSHHLVTTNRARLGRYNFNNIAEKAKAARTERKDMANTPPKRFIAVGS